MPDRTLQSAVEKDLIAAAAGGSTAALGELYSRYYHRVVYRCLTFVKNEDTARDLAQDVLLKVIENLRSFHQQASFSTWLYTIATNHCLDYLRREKKKHSVPLEEGLHIGTDTEGQEEQLKLLLQESTLKRLLQKLSKKDRSLLLAKYCDDKSIRELQKSYHLSASAVKMRLKRARQKLIVLLNQSAGR